jgi:hypothetical protein
VKSVVERKERKIARPGICTQGIKIFVQGLSREGF